MWRNLTTAYAQINFVLVLVIKLPICLLGNVTTARRLYCCQMDKEGLRYEGNVNESKSQHVDRQLAKQRPTDSSIILKISETMDQTFDRLQKLISQLEIQGEVINPGKMIWNKTHQFHDDVYEEMYLQWEKLRPVENRVCQHSWNSQLLFRMNNTSAVPIIEEGHCLLIESKIGLLLLDLASEMIKSVKTVRENRCSAKHQNNFFLEGTRKKLEQSYDPKDLEVILIMTNKACYVCR
ncbi:hypothetical protein Tco_1234576 [Tanacetum coccineum]